MPSFLPRLHLLRWLAALLVCGCAPSAHPVRADPVFSLPPQQAPLPTDEAVLEVPIELADPLPDPATRERLVSLYRAVVRGEAVAAGEALDEAARTAPVLRGWTEVIGMRAAAGDTAAMRSRAAGIPPGAARAWGLGLLAGALEEQGSAEEALRVAEALTGESLPPGPAAAAWKRVGDLRRVRGDGAGARHAFAAAMEAAPGTRPALDAARAASDLGGLPADEQRLAASTLLRHGALDEGVARSQAFLGAGAGTEAERTALRLQGARALFAARRYAAAAGMLAPVAETSPEAGLLLGRVLVRQGREAEARARLSRVGEAFPSQEAAAEAWLVLGDLERGEDRRAQAREMYRRAIAPGARGAAPAEAAARLAGMALLAGDPGRALEDLEGFLARLPRDRSAAPALYWAGRLREATGGEAQALFDEARRADPVSFYGVRAAERLGARPGTLPLEPAPEIDEAAALEVRRAFFRIDVLKEVGLEEEAAWELAWLRDRIQDDPPALYLVAEGMMARGQPIAGALLGQEIQRRRGAWDERLLRIVYQFPFRELVEREALRHGLDPYLVAGLIRQESYFNARAVSPAGAIGLMQVMPETGRGLARRLGLRGFTPDDLRDPETNVRLGTVFLADQLRRWQTLTEAFAAYNAGPGRVVRWRAFPEARDEDLFVERIPFEETRTYVKRVRLHRHLYEYLYGAASGEPGY